LSRVPFCLPPFFFQEVIDKVAEKGTKCLSKKVAKGIAKQLLTHSPLLLLFLATQAEGAVNDCKDRGPAYAIANQLIPADLIEDLASAAANSAADGIENYVTNGQGFGQSVNNHGIPGFGPDGIPLGSVPSPSDAEWANWWNSLTPAQQNYWYGYYYDNGYFDQ